MYNKVLLRFAAFCISASLLGACGARPVLPFALPFAQVTSTSTPTATPVPPTYTPRAEGLCSNSLSPVKLGATWTYAVNTSATTSPSGFSTTITDVRPDGFSTATKTGDVTVNQAWACKPEGLLALSMGAGQSLLDLNLQGVKLDLVTSNPTGVTLPADVQPGQQWLYGLDLAGKLTQGNLEAKVTGSVSTPMQAIGTETITVPAGTFNAIKIQATSTFKMTADFNGLSLPITSVLTSTFWFAPGVGWVQSVSSGELVGATMSATIKLQSYSIP